MSTLGTLKSGLLRTATNLRGWRTRRKLVIFESDDWGAIRMPGPEAYGKLLKSGIRVDRSRYDLLDCLESRGDFQALMNVLDAHRDASGRPPVFTFNTVMGNPDFEAIERDGFERFHHQHLFDSYRYYHGEDLEPCWKDAMEQGLIRPQFHAREHLNSPLWMRDLRVAHRETRLAFDHRFYGLKTCTTSPYQKNYLAAYWPDSPGHMDEINAIVEDGLVQFERAFGYSSSTFIGCNYVWPEALEALLARHGVRLLQTQRGHKHPDPERLGAISTRRHYTGEKNRHGQRYGVRNVLFEPYLEGISDCQSKALTQVSQAFRLGKPAVICSHRINYVGGMNMKHRDHSLNLLDCFVTSVCTRWPDVEFITSDELVTLMES